jgi:hypothetical protein
MVIMQEHSTEHGPDGVRRITYPNHSVDETIVKDTISTNIITNITETYCSQPFRCHRDSRIVDHSQTDATQPEQTD